MIKQKKDHMTTKFGNQIGQCSTLEIIETRKDLLDYWNSFQFLITNRNLPLIQSVVSDNFVYPHFFDGRYYTKRKVPLEIVPCSRISINYQSFYIYTLTIDEYNCSGDYYTRKIKSQDIRNRLEYRNFLPF